jgi:hypothetical protein
VIALGHRRDRVRPMAVVKAAQPDGMRASGRGFTSAPLSLTKTQSRPIPTPVS